MVREPLDLLAETVAMERLDRVHESRVQVATPLLQEAAVRDLVGERMLERVLQIRKQTRLVQELGRLQMREPAPKILFTQIGDGQQQRERHVLADDGGRLEQSLVVQREAVDARRENRLDRRGYLGRRGIAREPVGATATDERSRLDE